MGFRPSGRLVEKGKPRLLIGLSGRFEKYHVEEAGSYINPANQSFQACAMVRVGGNQIVVLFYSLRLADAGAENAQGLRSSALT